MSLALRLSLVIASLWALGFIFVVRFEVNETNRRYREATEEPLADTANLLAGILSAEFEDTGDLAPKRFQLGVKEALATPLNAIIYDLHKTSSDLHIYVTDQRGIVVFDSFNEQMLGKDLSDSNDVILSLKGEYGARMVHLEDSKETTLMQVAAPIRRGSEIIGVVSVGKPTNNAGLFILAAKRSTLITALVTFLLVTLLTVALSLLVTRPIRLLTSHVRKLRDGVRDAAPKLKAPELSELNSAFEELVQKLEGKKYVERYVQALTHEIKSPLTSIKGALEVLRSDPTSVDRDRFLTNIESESDRIQRLSEKLLSLSSLEATAELQKKEEFSIEELIAESLERVEGLASRKGITINRLHASDLRYAGHRLWLGEALTNLLQNALEFSPNETEISIEQLREQNSLKIEILDSGSGIPDWAVEKIYQRFFSLPRPDTNKRSSGLGLALVKEIIELHEGTIGIKNRVSGGTHVSISLPI